MSYHKLSDKKIRSAVLLKYNNRCAYCGESISIKTLTIDHIIPKRRGMNPNISGANHIDNYNPSCAPCNISKSCMDLEVWRKEISLKVNRITRDSSTFRMIKRFGLIDLTDRPVIFYFEKVNA